MERSLYPGKRWHGSEANQQEVRAALERGLKANAFWEKTGVVPHGRGKTLEHAFWPHFNTPLHYALWHGDLESAGLLLAAGANVDQLNYRGRSPLHEAVFAKRHNVIEWLLRRGANPNKRTINSPIDIEQHDDGRRARRGELCVLVAIYQSDEVALRLLLAVNVDLYAPRPWTVLDIALWAGNPRLVEMLIEKDATLLSELRVSASQPRSISSVSVDLALELVRAANGDELVPRQDVYDPYCNALRMSREQITEPVDAASLVSGFSDNLRVAAGGGSAQVCRPCRRVQVMVGSSKGSPVQMHESKQRLDLSAESGCPWCCLVADAIDHEAKRADSSGDGPEGQQASESPCPIELHTDKKTTECWVTWGKLRAEIPVTSYSQGWMECLRGLDQPDHATNSSNSLKIARTWLRECQRITEHEGCVRYHASNNKSLPKRLLYLGELRNPPRIVESSLITVAAPYVALSYCWGTRPFLTLTRQTYDHMQHALNIESLPILFQDAIAVARGLGFLWIWIDSLCIVQDDVDDWAHETANMHTIFAGASLTVSTVTAGDPFTSLFHRRKHRITHPVPLDFWTPRSDRQHQAAQFRIATAVPRWVGEDFAWRGLVHLRAWALQEQMLSTRILWFGDGMIFFECMKGFKLEIDPMHDAWYSQSESGKKDMLEHLATTACIKGAPTPQLIHKGRVVPPFRVWQRLVQELTERGITKQSDRLPALGPLTARIGRLSGEKVAHGIFVGDIALRALCWRSRIPSRKSDLVPSWLWASMSGRVTYDLDDSDEREGHDEKPKGAHISDIDTRANTSLSHVSGSIKIKGRLWKKRPLTHMIMNRNLQASGQLDAWDRGHGLIHLDEPFEREEVFYAMALLDLPKGLEPIEPKPDPSAIFPSVKPAATLMLLLRQRPGNPGVFHRAGIALLPRSLESTKRLLEEPALHTLGPESDLRWVLDYVRVFENETITVI